MVENRRNDRIWPEMTLFIINWPKWPIFASIFAPPYFPILIKPLCKNRYFQHSTIHREKSASCCHRRKSHQTSHFPYRCSFRSFESWQRHDLHDWRWQQRGLRRAETDFKRPGQQIRLGKCRLFVFKLDQITSRQSSVHRKSNSISLPIRSLSKQRRLRW